MPPATKDAAINQIRYAVILADKVLNGERLLRPEKLRYFALIDCYVLTAESEGVTKVIDLDDQFRMTSRESFNGMQRLMGALHGTASEVFMDRAKACSEASQ